MNTCKVPTPKYGIEEFDAYFKADNIANDSFWSSAPGTCAVLSLAPALMSIPFLLLILGGGGTGMTLTFLSCLTLWLGAMATFKRNGARAKSKARILRPEMVEVPESLSSLFMDLSMNLHSLPLDLRSLHYDLWDSAMRANVVLLANPNHAQALSALNSRVEAAAKLRRAHEARELESTAVELYALESGVDLEAAELTIESYNYDS